MPEPDLPAATVSSVSTNSFFIGPYGLRAGWRLLIFLAMAAAMFFFVAFVFQSKLIKLLGTDFSARNVIVQELISFSIILIATFIMGRLERRRFAAYGLPARGFLGRNFWSGALWGFVMLSFIVAMMAATHAYSVAGLALSSEGVVKYGLLWALAFLMVGLFEEFSFRGYMQYTLTSGMGFWPAALITCLAFAGGHIGNPGENWVGVVEIVLIALFLCLALRRTGNSVVRHRLAHVVRLGREFLLFDAEQRHTSHRAHAESLVDRFEVVEWRQRRTGGKRVRSDRDHRRNSAAGEALSRGKVSGNSAGRAGRRRHPAVRHVTAQRAAYGVTCVPLSSRPEVQNGHRFARLTIPLKQNGHSFISTSCV